jgi:PhzF family phenazine biosynthesis protein
MVKSVIIREVEMAHTLFQVDAFTNQPFKGNPAAVCLLQEPQSEEWMQSLASEMNLSETAFLTPEGDGWRLRWFTPTTEVDLCGHATLASAMVLFDTQPQLKNTSLNFYTKSGGLSARWIEDGVQLDFPTMAYQPITVPHQLVTILGFTPAAAVRSGDYFLFEASNPSLIRGSAPNFAELERLPMPEVIITSISDDPDFDFISRFFAPQLGIDEDPVTGSAHCLLTPYWGNKLGKTTLKALQASKRSGALDLQLEGERVLITGQAKIIFKAELLV